MREDSQGSVLSHPTQRQTTERQVVHARQWLDFASTHTTNGSKHGQRTRYSLGGSSLSVFVGFLNKFVLFYNVFSQIFKQKS